jgi:hypothetical protein
MLLIVLRKLGKCASKVEGGSVDEMCKVYMPHEREARTNIRNLMQHGMS